MHFLGRCLLCCRSRWPCAGAPPRRVSLAAAPADRQALRVRRARGAMRAPSEAPAALAALADYRARADYRAPGEQSEAAAPLQGRGARSRVADRPELVVPEGRPEAGEAQ